jgi:triosephosphate isomerase
VNATPQQANEAHVFVRKIVANIYDRDTADAIRIQYGGSMKAENAKELLAQSDVDGGLIGGASLKAEFFAGIVCAK